MATLILIWRLVRKETLQPAISGFFAVGVSALIAYLVGESKGYFLLGIWSSLLYAAVFALSVLIRRPVVGYVWGWVNGRDRGWRKVRKAVFAFDLATVTWIAVFGARFVVQNHLYDADQTGLLGVARIAMGWPLTGVAGLFGYLAPSLVLDRILKARGGVAVAAVSATAVCGGCRVGIRPQAIQQLRAATGLMVCESCGRYLYWQD